MLRTGILKTVWLVLLVAISASAQAVTAINLSAPSKAADCVIVDGQAVRLDSKGNTKHCIKLKQSVKSRKSDKASRTARSKNQR